MCLCTRMKTKWLSEILTLDPVRDQQRIVHLIACYEFPFDITRSLEFALFRTYCVPSISGLLDQTGEFAQCPQKRYDDTDILISAIMEWGYDSSRGKTAIERINAIHAHFKIANDDFLYVLSTFIFEPIRWNRRFGWRIMTDIEKHALFNFWRAVGQRMEIKGIPNRYEEFERFNRHYEDAHFVFSDSNRRIGQTTCNLFASWFPAFARPLVKRVIYALMDEPTCRAFGFPHSSDWFNRIVVALVWLRGQSTRLLPARQRPRLRSVMRHPAYPDGHSVKDIWPTHLNKPHS